MASVTTFKINGVGLVLFERSKRAKQVSISVKPFKGVRVAVPYGLSFKKAAQFAQTKADWIKIHLEKMQQYERQGYFNSIPPDSIDRVKAKSQLTRRLQQLAKYYNFSYNRVFIRNQKTRWGSCSSKNNISLNLKLVKLPDELIDYVILHELVHTRRKDHSKAFWVEMDNLVGHGKKMSSRLKSYGVRLY
ncbi:M48 family metallopeptidase [Chloroflexota bacterium]